MKLLVWKLKHLRVWDDLNAFSDKDNLFLFFFCFVLSEWTNFIHVRSCWDAANRLNFQFVFMFSFWLFAPVWTVGKAKNVSVHIEHFSFFSATFAFYSFHLSFFILLYIYFPVIFPFIFIFFISFFRKGHGYCAPQNNSSLCVHTLIPTKTLNL